MWSGNGDHLVTSFRSRDDVGTKSELHILKLYGVREEAVGSREDSLAVY